MEAKIPICFCRGFRGESAAEWRPEGGIPGSLADKKKIIKKLCNRVKKFNYHEQTNNIAKLMLSSDLSIGSGGSTTWERCCIGLPAIISFASEYQRDVANAVSKKKCIINLGDEKKLKESDYLDAITSLKRNDLKKMSKKALTLVDGKGTERISRFIFSRFGND